MATRFKLPSNKSKKSFGKAGIPHCTLVLQKPKGIWKNPLLNHSVPQKINSQEDQH